MVNISFFLYFVLCSLLCLFYFCLFVWATMAKQPRRRSLAPLMRVDDDGFTTIQVNVDRFVAVDGVIKPCQRCVHPFFESTNAHVAPVSKPSGSSCCSPKLALVVYVLMPVPVKYLIEHISAPVGKPAFVSLHAWPLSHHRVVLFEESLGWVKKRRCIDCQVGSRQSQGSSWCQESARLSQKSNSFWKGNVFDEVLCDDPLETTVPKREPLSAVVLQKVQSSRVSVRKWRFSKR
mmetsp:Transcript_70015/g.137645  ORF Transcript_70015/g.137645 Transcript_70015/m.137645 type:complete len:234 (+) Transcript_70015:72-773(+)